jgi:ribosomal protein S12 methylthiotransferase
VGFISLGCAKNLVDSEHMAGVLRAANIALAASPDAADIVLINTCGFIGDAKEESIDAILRACARKQAGGCRAVIVAGCLSQRYRADLQKAMPEVDAFLGLDQLEEIAAVVRRVQRGDRGILKVSRVARKVFSPLPTRLLFTGGPFAYLKIAEGCNHRCAFCAIPGIRGRYRSRTITDIAREAETLLAQGIRELNLISQDTTRYGHDLGDGTDLPALLNTLGKLGGQFWIRLLYGHPAHLTDRLLATMAAVPQVCRYLDIPVQHAHDEVLRAMHRAGGGAAVAAFPARARERLPGVTLRTTCLVGFPGETRDHFRRLSGYVAESRFDHLGVFVFSPEENTGAATLPDPVPLATARRRRSALMRLQQELAFGRLAGRLGAVEDALLLTREGPIWTARLASQAPEVDGITRVRGVPQSARAGEFVKVRITATEGYDLLASAGIADQ